MGLRWLLEREGEIVDVGGGEGVSTPDHIKSQFKAG